MSRQKSDYLIVALKHVVLNEIYEERFCDSSYGFRPRRGAHDVVRIVNQAIMAKRVCYVLEADIKGFFDNVSHDWLMKFLEHDIADKNFLRYIKRFLKAGVMEGAERQDSEKGTPQGGLISPILANVYLHYVLDLWVEKVLKKQSRGAMRYVRYADDFILMFEYESEARACLGYLKARLKKFGLEVAEDKTRILPIGRFKGTKEDFDFLGFKFYNTKSRNGKYRLGVRTSKTRLKAKKQKVKTWLRSRLTGFVPDTMKSIGAALTGHYNYYGVNGNAKALLNFYKFVKCACYRMLNRRDQKGRFRWDKFQRMWEYYVKKPCLTVDIWNY
jgi:group II intron reverse transcriptase/maturase